MSEFGRLAMAAALCACSAAAPPFADDDTKPSDPNPPAQPYRLRCREATDGPMRLRDDVTDELKTILDFAVTDGASDFEIDTRVRFTNAATNAEMNAVQVFDPHWRLKDNGAWRLIDRRSRIVVFQPDIQVGKTWCSYNFELSRINPPGNFKYAGKAKVVSWERVSVRNGLAYDAFKIEFNTAHFRRRRPRGQGAARQWHRRHGAVPKAGAQPVAGRHVPGHRA